MSATRSTPEATLPSLPLTEPAHAGWWAALVYALCTLALGYPALGGRFLLNLFNDQYIGGYAFRDFAARSLRAGHGFPQWNPFFFGGMPYIAAMHGDIFYPTFLMRMVMPTDVAMTWEFLIHLWLAGIFTYGFLRAWMDPGTADIAVAGRKGDHGGSPSRGRTARDLDASFYPALIGGLAYMLTGIVASYAMPGHDGKLFVSALLPLGLWQLVRGVRDGRAWAWGAFAITVGLAVLSPHPMLLQHALLAWGFWALFLVFHARLPRDVAVRRLAFALGAVAIGMLIGAVQYLPVMKYVAWSPRAGGTPYEFAASYSFPLEELINVYLPQFTGILERYWGRNGIHFHSEYLGVVVLFLAPLAFGSRSRTAFARFWLGVAVVSLLWALGGNTPFFRAVYLVVPGTKYFRAPSTIYFVTAFAVSVLAALGAERLLAGRATARYAYGWLVGAGVVALLATTGLLAMYAASVAERAAIDILRMRGIDPAQVPGALAQFAARAHANDGALIAGAWRSLAFVAVAAGLCLARLRGAIRPTVLAWTLVAAVAADLWSIDRYYWQFMPPARTIFASDPAIELLKRQPQPGRVVVVARGDTNLVPRDPYFGTDRLGKGSGFMVHGIRTLTGYHSNELARYQLLGGEATAGVYRNTLVPAFWRHENARWLYTNSPLGARDTAFHLLVGPVRNSAGSTAWLYQVPGDNPYAWLTAASVAAPDSIALAAVASNGFDPARVAVFDTAAHLAVRKLSSLPEPSPVHATTTAYGPGRASIALDAPAPAGAALVVAENFYPGWTATVDGKPATAARVDFNLIGVPLPAGARRVELRFEDPGYGPGKLVTWLALLAALGATAAGLAADRRAAGAMMG